MSSNDHTIPLAAKDHHIDNDHEHIDFHDRQQHDYVDDLNNNFLDADDHNKYYHNQDNHCDIIQQRNGWHDSHDNDIDIVVNNGVRSHDNDDSGLRHAWNDYN